MKPTLKRKVHLSLFLWLVSSGCLLAGGSVRKEAIVELLKQDKQVFHLVSSTLELDRTGWGWRIGTRISRGLGGARVAPYTIRARPKGSDGPWIYKLEILADTRFLDDEGREVELKDATEIEERFKELQVTEIPSGTKPPAEQDGGDQPATEENSRPDGKEKPQPKSEECPQ